MNTLPTERDLPPDARAELRARVVDTVGAPTPSRRWIPLAAAAGLAAVVAGTAVTVAVTRGDPPPVAEPVRTATASPTASPTPSPGPSPRPTPGFTPIPKRTGPATVSAMLADCTTYARNTARGVIQDNSPSSLKVLFHDRYGYLIEIVTAKLDFQCDMSPNGAFLNGTGSSRNPGLGSELGYITRPGIAVEVTAHGGATPQGPGRNTNGYSAAGHVRRGVARVVVTWQGLPPVTAALDGAYFIARVAAPGRPANSLAPGIAVAYDAAGHELGSSRVFR